MKISLSEIWNFSELIEASEKGWSYNLVAGGFIIKGLSHELLLELKNDENYDTELLPEVFTFREILWQPDVFTESISSLPALRILKAHCEDICERFDDADKQTLRVYRELLAGLAKSCEKAIVLLEGGENQVNKALGLFRKEAFPIVKFFIYHPQNRLDYYRDAVNRLNYAVKVMLTQFNGKYTDLADPYWEVSYQISKKEEKSAPEADKEVEKP